MKSPWAPVQEGAALCWRCGCPIHKKLQVTYMTSVTWPWGSLQTLIVTIHTVTSTLTYIIHALCHMSVGVTSNTYCNCQYCTFTVTSALTYIMHNFCHLVPNPLTSAPLPGVLYNVTSTLTCMLYYICRCTGTSHSPCNIKW